MQQIQKSMLTIDIGERIRAVRCEIGMQLVELARQIGISKGYLSLLERGYRTLTAEQVRRMAGVLDISVSALYGETDWRDEVVPTQKRKNPPARITKAELGRRLRPLLGSRAQGAVGFLARWLEAEEGTAPGQGTTRRMPEARKSMHSRTVL